MVGVLLCRGGATQVISRSLGSKAGAGGHRGVLCWQGGIRVGSAHADRVDSAHAVSQPSDHVNQAAAWAAKQVRASRVRRL